MPKIRDSDAHFGLALLTSLVLHVAILVPNHWFARDDDKHQAVPLNVMLAMPKPSELEETTAAALATRPEQEPQAAPLPPLPPPAVLPAPTFSRPLPPARELKGRALESALAKMAQEEFYPREAIARGLEGRVVLLLTLDEAGRVLAIETASSSGHALLDEAARQAAGRIASLPGGRRQVLLPVEFRLE